MFHLTSKIMANNKYCGNVADYQPVSEDHSRVVIMYGLNPTEGEMAEWRQIEFYKKQGRPSFEQVKAAIIADINERVKALIIGGFVWNGKPVWLSEENQMNFAQAVVPATFKIGEDANGDPIYQEFNTKTELKNFVEACVAWKQQCLSAGWAEKDSMDWTPYAEALQPVTD
jgi:hypothetical protein